MSQQAARVSEPKVAPKPEQFRTLTGITHGPDRTHVLPGEVVSLSDEDALSLLASEAIEPVKG